MRLQQRSGRLHMVDAYDENRYYIRVGLSTRPMSAHEVEAAFRCLATTDSEIDDLIASCPS